jgi:hypothetical protein
MSFIGKKRNVMLLYKLVTWDEKINSYDDDTISVSAISAENESDDYDSSEMKSYIKESEDQTEKIENLA